MGEQELLDIEENTKDVARRNFMKEAMAALGGAAAFLAALPGQAASISRSDVADVLSNPDAFPDGNALERMRTELKGALQKPVDQRKWVMVIDLKKCVGCKACTVSCVAENNLPPGVVYRPVTEEEVGTFPNVRRKFVPRPCMHCDESPCTPVCPVGATYKRPDGIVVIDYDECIGCRYCISACPYNARTADFGGFYGEGTPEVMDYETRPNFEYGKEWAREPGKHDSPVGNAHKCHFCLHRIENNMLPACVTTCL
ncbi:MAG: 4Fe-4S dicluster domain-containing protein, partial [Candidatus Latescibacteria bacterium]|nr:4Fe-4S dicluster domain-containing protein [Candidatus Latescibacterota bacterium]